MNLLLCFMYPLPMIQAPTTMDISTKDISIAGLLRKLVNPTAPNDNRMGREIQCIAQRNEADRPNIDARL